MPSVDMGVTDLDLQELQRKIRYTFRDRALLRLALTHSSYSNEHGLSRLHSNERLEFLGDAVLEVITSDYLFHTFPDKPEGEMTKQRASIVCEPTLAACADEVGLGDYLYLGKGEESAGGRGRHSIVSDALEAVIGAIYLDGGFASAKEFVEGFVLSDLDQKELFFDSKTILQEIAQKDGQLVSYDLLGESGPDHNKVFEASVSVGGELLARGRGKSKKAAEQAAAQAAIETLGDRAGGSWR
ncbi:MAG: ribonuclease III [Lachnospiraceae bacterium]|nr:ribonuclease III [Lachnospiraceae bacterium]